ncbi:MAG: hypothetical protein WCD54_13225, partial [Pseudolabrys sp.]
ESKRCYQRVRCTAVDNFLTILRTQTNVHKHDINITSSRAPLTTDDQTPVTVHRHSLTQGHNF